MVPRTGYTLIELLVFVALVSTVAVLGTLRPPNVAAHDARRLASAIASERIRAVAVGQASDSVCIADAGPAVLTARVEWPPRGLLFTPDGLPRTCDGGGVGNTTILLEHRGRQAAVIVSSLGRVRWELR